MTEYGRIVAHCYWPQVKPDLVEEVAMLDFDDARTKEFPGFIGPPQLVHITNWLVSPYDGRRVHQWGWFVDVPDEREGER